MSPSAAVHVQYFHTDAHPVIMSMIRSLVASVLLTGVVSAKTIDVTVGNGAILAYHPSNITADVGDEVAFTFYPRNHTVNQASFENPCVPFLDLSPLHPAWHRLNSSSQSKTPRQFGFTVARQITARREWLA
jgi:plastocyanin